MRLKRSGKSSWRSVQIADISWYFFRNVVVKNYKRKRWCSWVFPEQYDGTAPISILIVHKFQVKVSVCTARWRWGCGSSPVCLGLGPITATWATASGWTMAPWPTWATSSPSKYGWPLPQLEITLYARFQIWNCPGNIFWTQLNLTLTLARASIPLRLCQSTKWGWSSSNSLIIIVWI